MKCLESILFKIQYRIHYHYSIPTIMLLTIEYSGCIPSILSYFVWIFIPLNISSTFTVYEMTGSIPKAVPDYDNQKGKSRQWTITTTLTMTIKSLHIFCTWEDTPLYKKNYHIITKQIWGSKEIVRLTKYNEIKIPYSKNK